MAFDKINEIGIDKSERLYIVPNREQFPMIWRSAAEVHWDADRKCLFSPKPREWGYYQWFCHMIDIVKENYGCELLVTNETKWSNVPNQVREQIGVTDRIW